MFSHDLGNGDALRLLEEHHAPALFAVVDANRAHLRRWLPWLDVNTEAAHSLGYIRMTRQQIAANTMLAAGIWSGDRLVGMIDLHQINRTTRQAAIGYWLAEQAQGRGLITRAVRALIAHAFHEWKLNRVELRAAVENRPSRAVAERLGFTLEGTIRDAEWLYDHFVDHAVYGLLAREWPAHP